MAFQGVDNSNMMQLAMMLMDRRRQARQDQLAEQQAQIKALQGFEKHKLDMENARLDQAEKRAALAEKLRGPIAQGVTEAREGLDRFFTPSDFAGLGREDAGQFAQILAENDPKRFDPIQGAAAEDVYNDRMDLAARTRLALGGESNPYASVIGAANAYRGAEEREREIQFDTERRTRSERAIGDAEAMGFLNKEIRRLRGEIKAAQRSGVDTRELEDELRAYEDFRTQKANAGSLRTVNPPSPNLIDKWQTAMSADSNAIAVIDRLVDGLDSGKISAGVVGTIRYYAEGIQNVFEDLAGTAIFEGPNADQFQDLVDQARSGVSGIAFSDSNGEQMTLSLDAMTLAWQFARANRDSARITMLEFEKALKALAPTGAFKSEKQFRSALAKVAEVTLRRARKREAVINATLKDQPDLLNALKFDSSIGEYDRGYLRRIRTPGRGRSPQVERKSKAGGEKSGLRLRDVDEDMTEDDVVRALRNEMEALRSK